MLVMWYHLDLAVGDERPTVDTVIDRMYIPSPEKGAGDCDINHRTRSGRTADSDWRSRLIPLALV